MGTKRLYKSRDNKVLFGICGGIGEYFGIDPVIVRIILVIFCLIGFGGVLLYIIAYFVIPEAPTVKMNVAQQDFHEYGGTPTYTTVTKDVVESEAVVTEEKPSEPENTI